MPKRAVCDLKTGVNWWLEESDQCRCSSGSRRLYCDEIAQVRREEDWRSMSWK